MRDLPTLLSGWRAQREKRTPGPLCVDDFHANTALKQIRVLDSEGFYVAGITLEGSRDKARDLENAHGFALEANISAALAAVVEAAAVVDASLDLPKTEYSGPEWAALKMNRDALSALHALLDQEVPQ